MQEKKNDARMKWLVCKSLEPGKVILHLSACLNIDSKALNMLGGGLPMWVAVECV